MQDPATSVPIMETLSLEVNSHAAMLQVPLEIIYLIADNLGLSDKLFLSQTCTALRRIMFRDWKQEASKLSREDRFAFWEGIAHQSTNHWACQKCCKLHLANGNFLKTIGDNCLPCGFKLPSRLHLDGCFIDYHHVQFALKLSRLGNMEQKHLEMMIKPFRWISKFTGPTHYTADARIINEQFLFRQQWKASGHEDKKNNMWSQTITRWTLFRERNITICPHLCLRGGLNYSRAEKRKVSATIQTQSWTTTPRVITDLEDGIDLALESSGQWVFISCPRCPTDCGIIISEGNKEATIRSWHDLGTEGPQSATRWGVHVSAGIYDDWIDQGMKVDYTQGSIRALWLENEVVG
ncbi:hypothetical protein HDV62DRAFT_399474 [Trichoderma sp. SZMC 28011]